MNNVDLKATYIWQDFCENLYALYKKEGYSYANILEIIGRLKVEFKDSLKKIDKDIKEKKI